MKPRIVGTRCSSSSSRITPRASSNCSVRSSGRKPASLPSADAAAPAPGLAEIERSTPSTRLEVISIDVA
jgi:hypothetical protein